MFMTNWVTAARLSGHICPRCQSVLPKWNWSWMQKHHKDHCYNCHIKEHWADGLGSKGSVEVDNREFDQDILVNLLMKKDKGEIK